MRHLMLLVLSSLVLASTACTTYQIRSAESHGTMPVMKLETIRTTYLLFLAEVPGGRGRHSARRTARASPCRASTTRLRGPTS